MPWKSTMPPNTTCTFCGSLIYLYPSRIAQSKVHYCNRHCYNDAVQATKSDTETRFWSFVRKTDSCWMWEGASQRRGYGVFNFEGKTQRTHRVVWMLTYGPIPDGLFVLHRCDNPRCVRPDHLFLGTNQDNVDDMIQKGRGLKGRPVQGRSFSRGEGHYKAILTEEDVRQMRQLSTDGMPTDALMARFGVARQTVYKVLSRHSWKHVL